MKNKLITELKLLIYQITLDKRENYNTDNQKMQAYGMINLLNFAGVITDTERNEYATAINNI